MNICTKQRYSGDLLRWNALNTYLKQFERAITYERQRSHWLSGLFEAAPPPESILATVDGIDVWLSMNVSLIETNVWKNVAPLAATVRHPDEKTRIGSCRILFGPVNSDDRSPIGSECRNPMWFTQFRRFPTVRNDRFQRSDSDYFRRPNPDGTDQSPSEFHRNLYEMKTRRIVMRAPGGHIVILLYSFVSPIERRHSLLLLCHRRKRFTTSSPVVATPQSYLLFLRGTDECFIVKKTSIKTIDGDCATVVIGAKHRQTEIEAQGIDHRPPLSSNDLFSYR